MKIRETGLDRFHRFLINLNLIFLKILIFFLKWFIGITDRFIGFDGFQSLSADRFTGFDTGHTDC
jgi:hypothetical protein